MSGLDARALGRHDLVSELSEAEPERLAGRGADRRYQRGQIIFAEGIRAPACI